MRRQPRIPLHRRFASIADRHADRPSFGFSGAGFLGCYHVGAVACLNRHGWLPRPDDDGSRDPSKVPRLTGVSAGSMIAAAVLAGVDPETDGMEVVLEAARRTRELSSRRKRDPRHPNGDEGKSSTARPPGLMENLGVSLDVLTPGFSLIDQVEGPFRDALARALGGYCEKDPSNDAYTFHDIDPDLFARRFPLGRLRIGLADRRELWPPPLLKAYRYVDTYRNLEDVVACSMLSSYIPGGTGPLKIKDNVPNFIGGLFSNPDSTDVSDRAGLHLKEMTKLGMVKNGSTGLPTVEGAARGTNNDEDAGDNSNKSNEPTTFYWDGGLADMFPTFDNDTVIISPLNGLYSPNPSISPEIPDMGNDESIANENGKYLDPPIEQEHRNTKEDYASTSVVQNYLQSYLPSTFRHCPKSKLGLNRKNADMALQMAFSSDDEELYVRFRDGYDDARRFLNQRGHLRVFRG